MNRPAKIYTDTFNSTDIEIDAFPLVAPHISVAATNDETRLSKRQQEEIMAWAQHAQANNGFG
jgi:hypothetical protein